MVESMNLNKDNSKTANNEYEQMNNVIAVC